MKASKKSGWRVFVSFLLGFSLLPAPLYAFDASLVPGHGPLLKASQGNLPVTAKPKSLEGVSVQENLGKTLDLRLTFINQDKKKISLAQMLNGKPLVLSLNYFRCTTLCTLQILNLSRALKQMNWPVGKDYNVATVSIDPKDSVEEAKIRRDGYLQNLGLSPQSFSETNGWNFYIGQEKTIHELARELGFFYRYDPETDQYAHGAVLFFITPDGVISRYLYGIQYAPVDMKFALMEASKKKIGNPTEQVLLTCFHYNPLTGKYDAFAIGFLRIGAGITLVLLFGFLIYYFKRDKKKYKG